MSGGREGEREGGERVEKGLRRHRNAQRRFVTSVASGASRASGKGEEDRSRIGEKGCCGIFFLSFLFLFFFFAPSCPVSRRSSLFLSFFLYFFFFFILSLFIFMLASTTQRHRRRTLCQSRHAFDSLASSLMSFRGKKRIRVAFPTSTGTESSLITRHHPPPPPLVDQNDSIRCACTRVSFRNT